MFMSSSMRWRSGLMGFSLIGGSCLEVGVLDPSILKTERPPVTCARSNSYCGRRNAPTARPAPPAEAGSFFDPQETSERKPTDNTAYVDVFASGRFAIRTVLTHCNTVSPF